MAAVVAGGCLLAGWICIAPAGASPAVSPYGFAQPSGLAVDGGHLWVTNEAGNSVTIVNATSGKLSKVLSGPAFQLSEPDAILADGPNLFIANRSGSVTEIAASTHALVRNISGSSYGFSQPVALRRSGTNLFVVNKGGSVTELSTTTGALVRTIQKPRFHFSSPVSAAIAQGYLFVANEGNNTVTEINVSTGALVQVISAPAYQFSQPDGIGTNGTYVWVAIAGNAQVTQFLASTGAFVQTLDDSGGYGFGGPGPTLVHGGDVYVASPPGDSPMVTGFSADGQSSLYWYMCNTNGPYQFAQPSAMAVYQSNLWVANSGPTPDATYSGNSLTEMNASTGALIRTVY